MDKFINKYKNQLCKLIEDMDSDIIKQIVDSLENSYKKMGKIYVIGNGGSAATASHMVNDLGIGLKRRSLKNFNIESLADNVAVCTAIANDIGYENIFLTQLKDNIQEKDILIAISCSGNSDNIIRAVEYSKSIKATVIGVTGFDGGKLKKLSDINFHVQTQANQYGLVEDIHMILNHILYTYFIEESMQKET